MIVDFIQKQHLAAKIDFSDGGENAGILQRLYKARTTIDERAFVTYGDTLIDVDLSAMIREHQTRGASLTLTTAQVRNPFGLITADKDRHVLAFDEKPLETFFAGHMLLERSLLEDLDQDLLSVPEGGGLIELIQRLIRERQVFSFPYEGPQVTFNTKQDLAQAENQLLRFYTHQEGSPDES